MKSITKEWKKHFDPYKALLNGIDSFAFYIATSSELIKFITIAGLLWSIINNQSLDTKTDCES